MWPISGNIKEKDLSNILDPFVLFQSRWAGLDCNMWFHLIPKYLKVMFGGFPQSILHIVPQVTQVMFLRLPTLKSTIASGAYNVWLCDWGCGLHMTPLHHHFYKILLLRLTCGHLVSILQTKYPQCFNPSASPSTSPKSWHSDCVPQ